MRRYWVLPGEKMYKRRNRMYRLGLAWGWRCHYCAVPLRSVERRSHPAPYGSFRLGPETDLEVGTFDHFIPTSRGGGHGIGNQRLACTRCNHRKGDKMPGEFDPRHGERIQIRKGRAE